MLRIYRPDADPVLPHDPSTDTHHRLDDALPGSPVNRLPQERDSTEGPAVLSFTDWVEEHRGDVHSAALRRARAIHRSQRCPDCERARIIPLELRDGRLDGSGQFVPGSSTLVGFRCEHCRHEWSTYLPGA